VGQLAYSSRISRLPAHSAMKTFSGMKKKEKEIMWATSKRSLMVWVKEETALSLVHTT